MGEIFGTPFDHPKAKQAFWDGYDAGLQDTTAGREPRDHPYGDAPEAGAWFGGYLAGQDVAWGYPGPEFDD
jgi:hypothetical protein